LEEILKAAIGIDGAAMGTIHRYDPGTGMLTIVAHRGLSKEFVREHSEVHVRNGSAGDPGAASGEEGAPARAARTGARGVIRDAHEDRDLTPSDRAAATLGGYRAGRCTPLLTRHGELLGVISTYFRAPHASTDHEQRVMDVFARQASDL